MRKKGSSFKHKKSSRSDLQGILQTKKSLNEKSKQNIALSAWQALDLMDRGLLNDQGAMVLASLVNVALCLCVKDKVGVEYESELRLAGLAMKRVVLSRRYADSYSFSKEDISYIKDAIEVHEAQLPLITYYRLIEAVREVDREMMRRPVETA